MAFKDGVRGILRFKGLLALMATMELCAAVLIDITHGSIQNEITLISLFIPPAIMFLMSCSYGLEVATPEDQAKLLAASEPASIETKG
jgi:hypothetical protein